VKKSRLWIYSCGVAFATATLWGCAPGSGDKGAPQARADTGPEAGGAPVTVQETTLDPANLDPAKMTDEQWRAKLTPEQYRILREKGTERAFTGAYWDTKDEGVYRCAGCGEALFTSDTKFDSGCGWPSFYQASAKGKIDEHVDRSHGMVRTEVTCAKCGGHLGHVFEDGPAPTGLRYCINSASIDLEKKDNAKPDAP